MNDFDDLTIDQRANYIWTHGTFIDSRTYYNQRINLYGVNGQYFEVWYNPTDNKIEDVKWLTDEKRIELYLAKIN